MSQNGRRWLGWSILIALSLVCLLTAGFLTFWFVVWPFPPGFVLMNTPRAIPFVRASAALGGRTEGQLIWDAASLRFRDLVSADPSRVQSDLVSCLRGDDQVIRCEALSWVHVVAGQTTLAPALCAEIVRATTEVHQSEVRWAALQIVRYLPDAEPRLMSMFKSGDRDLQFAAVASLARMGNQVLTKQILPLLEDPRIEVRRWALQLLSLTRDPAATSAVMPFLKDSDQDARMWAGRFLRDVNQPFGE